MGSRESEGEEDKVEQEHKCSSRQIDIYSRISFFNYFISSFKSEAMYGFYVFSSVYLLVFWVNLQNPRGDKTYESKEHL